LQWQQLIISIPTTAKIQELNLGLLQLRQFYLRMHPNFYRNYPETTPRYCQLHRLSLIYSLLSTPLSLASAASTEPLTKIPESLFSSSITAVGSLLSATIPILSLIRVSSLRTGP